MPLPPPLVFATEPELLTVSSFYPAITRLLMGRKVAEAVMAEAVRKGILELTENYKFAALQETGPVVSLVPYQAVYSVSFFLTPIPGFFYNLELEKVNSFFLYNNTYVAPSSGNLQTNAGYNLKFRTINDIEILINIPGVPIYWTRHEGKIWIGSMPDNSYNIYMRYQVEHPFPLAGGVNAGDDPIKLPRSWQDICEYMSAMRCAQELNLSNKVTELHTRLYGDTKFQQSGGLEGSPGLIFQRTSQQYRDQTTSQKSMRLRMGGV